MTQLNEKGREIWFSRVLWSYIPSHWKGWALIAGVVAAGNASIWLLIWISGVMGGSQDDDWSFLVIIPFVLLGWWLAERHSPSRNNDWQPPPL